MTKLVVLKFSGSLASGFLVNAEIGQEGKTVECGCTASLPPARELNYYLTTWQQHYYLLGNNHRIKPQQIIYDGSINPYQRLIKSANKLQQALGQWLDSHDFSPINKRLREALSPTEAARILICSDRPEIYQLPWCCWDLVESYPKLEIAVSNPNFARVPFVPTRVQHQRVKILAILGDSQGINLEEDSNFLDTLDTGAVKFLVEPTIQQLYEHLWQEPWDIVFFAGHSRTIERQGILYLNPQDRLTIEQLKHGFKQAIASGLQLAIFNSCDGLGLAEELGQLSLPQSIVMRLPIPDQMAQQFMKYFLQAYAGGNSLYLSLRTAREQLQSWEKQFPCASWLPVIYQNPAVIPPQWSDLCPQADTSVPFQFKFSNLRQLLIKTIFVAAIATTVVWLLQFWGWLAPGELNVYDRLMVWGYNPPIDPRVIVVTIDDQDLIYQKEQPGMTMNLGSSLADAMLQQLVQKLEIGQVKAIASDVIHDFPFEPQLADTIAQNDHFVGICRIKNPPTLVSIAPPSQLEEPQLGFSNWAIDDDGTIRRQILGMSPDEVCATSFSLSLRLALKYLGDVPTKFNAQDPLEINHIVFPRLQTASGGYHLPETQGYQILLNYRRTIPQTIPLRTILSMSQPDINNLVQDKIVLIGVKGYNHDLHNTPYSRGQQAKRAPGVVIHAQMTSQIIDVVLGEQKLLRWVPEGWEMLWISLWSMIGAVIILGNSSSNSSDKKRSRSLKLLQSPIKIMIAIAVSLALLCICCWGFLINSIWITAIAPAFGLILAAIIALVYSSFQEDRLGY
jgi:CHASE2 domain-containing sensor protein